MKIRRKPKVGGQWSDTDAKDPIDLVDEWKPGTTFVLDGTIDKDGSRHSLIGLDISEDDIQALLIKLIQSYKDRIDLLEQQNVKISIENDQRKATFQRLEDLLDPYVHPDLFLNTTQDIPRLVSRLYNLVQYGSSENLIEHPIPHFDEEE